MISPLVIEQTLERVQFNADGLLCAIAQDAETGDILMQAWMNREALAETLATGRGVYWSRSRGRLWRKGETSGQQQQVMAVYLDCDYDCVVLKVQQQGVACHTGRRSCFFYQVTDAGLEIVAPVLIAPDDLYS